MFSEIDHRPWPMPRRPWVMRMEWHELLFIHWPINPAVLRAYLPPGLELDTFAGQAWLGVVPFEMRGVRPRFVPPLPWISAFPELNVRTYVRAGAKPGVWFFSLDAGNPLAVRGARYVFHLPYYDAAMACASLAGKKGRAEQGPPPPQPTSDNWVRYASRRTHRGAPHAAFVARYRPTGPVYRAAPGSLDEWLTERYCLYAANRRGRIWRGEIHHVPWPLQPAEAVIERNTMADQLGLILPRTPPLLHFVRRLDVVAWALDRVET